MSATEYMVTTLDNPYSPFTQWDEWYAFDLLHGYDTCGALARLAPIGMNLFEDENTPILNSAIDDLLNADPFNRWIRVSKESYERIKSHLGSHVGNSIEIPK